MALIKYLLSLLATNLPFRESYTPSIPGIVYTYIIPILLGFIVTKLFLKNKSFLNILSLSLVSALVWLSPLLLNLHSLTASWSDPLSIIFYFLLFPVLFVFGSLPFYFNFSLPEPVPGPESHLDYALALGFGTFILLFNLVPVVITPYLFGADVYYHAAVSQHLVNFSDIFKNGFFIDSPNYYYSIVYFIVSRFALLTGLKLVTAWSFYVPLCSFFFMVFYYLFVRRNTHSTQTAFIASLFVLPLNQMMAADPSVRTLSYVFFIVSLYFFQGYRNSPSKKSLLWSIIFWLLTIASHPEIALHALAIVAVFFVLSKIHFKFKPEISVVEKPFYFLLIFSVYVLFLIGALIYVLLTFQIDKILIYNEIAFSLFQPIGVISLLVFLFSPFGILLALKKFTPNYRLLLAIAALYGSVLFYFTKLWVIYHRYFAETAYLALAVFAAIFCSFLISLLSKPAKIIFYTLLAILMFFSIYPKYNFVVNRSQASNKYFTDRYSTIILISELTPPNSVILMPSEDMLNRYLPIYTNRYIYAGSSIISHDRQWQVLSICNGPFSSFCNRRQKLADEFFTYPSTTTLRALKSAYQVNYLLLSKTDDALEYQTLLQSSLNFTPGIIFDSDNLLLVDLSSSFFR